MTAFLVNSPYIHPAFTQLSQTLGGFQGRVVFKAGNQGSFQGRESVFKAGNQFSANQVPRDTPQTTWDWLKMWLVIM